MTIRTLPYYSDTEAAALARAVTLRELLERGLSTNDLLYREFERAHRENTGAVLLEWHGGAVVICVVSAEPFAPEDLAPVHKSGAYIRRREYGTLTYCLDG